MWKKRAEPQQYDNRLKSLFSEEAKLIIPLLLQGVKVLGERNIEIDRSKLKADLVYDIEYEGEDQILLMELQTQADESIVPRMLQYASGLHIKHNKTVISVVLYPFQTHIPTSPYQMKSQKSGRMHIDYYFVVICLWELDAQSFVKEYALCMYSLLPAMNSASVPLLKKALVEMQTHYDRVDFESHLIRFRLMVKRSTTMSKEEKQEIEEEINMHYKYNWIIDENPEVQQRMARVRKESWQEGIVEGEQKGEQKGIVKGLQQGIVSVIKGRFPDMEGFARLQVQQITEVEALEQLMMQIVTIPDETAMLQRLYAISARGQRNA